MTSSIHATRALVPSRADLLPPRKRFKDSISPEDSVEEDIDTDVLEDIEADDMAVEVAVDMDIMVGVNASIDMEVDVRVDAEDEVEDEVESSDRGTIEVRVDVVAMIDILDAMLKPYVVEHLEQIEEASLLDQVASLERRNARLRGIMMMKRARADRDIRCEATRAANALEAESQSQNGSDGNNRNGGNGNGRDGNGGDRNGGNGNGGDGNGGDGNPNENNRGARLVARECTYQDFKKCQPLNFKGTKGVVGLIRWFEKMELIFHISNCPKKHQVKYATCTLLNSALTRWKSHKRTIGTDVAFAMSWRELMKLMAKVYCPRTKIQKMESELWNLTVKNNDLTAYTQRFQELTMMCTKMVPEEEDRVEKFIGGLPDNIQGNVIAAEPTRLHDDV
ncbi:putative reverse transcriptase domain-containing protein [Tanacetum coccineum]